MMMQRLGMAVVGGLVALTTLSRAKAQDALATLPPETAAVIRIAPPDQLVGNVNDMIAAIGLPPQVPAPPIEQGLGELLGVSGRLDVLDGASPAYLAVFALSGSTEPIARLVKTSDETKLRRAVLRAGDDVQLQVEDRDDGFVKVSTPSRSAYFRKHGAWVIYTVNEAVVPLLNLDPDSQGAFAAALEPRTKELLAGGDAAIAVNVAHLTETFREPIEQARQQVLEGIEQLPDEALQAGGANPEAVKSMYSGLARFAFNTLFDTQWAGGNIAFSAEGADGEGLLTVRQESGTDALLAANPASAMEMLEVLPGGSPVYFGGKFNVAYMMQWFQGYMGFMVAGDAAKEKAIGDAVKQFEEAGLGQFAAGYSFPTDANSGMLVSMLFQAQDAEVLRKAFGAYAAAMGEIKTPLFTQRFEFQPAAETYKDRPVDMITQHVEYGTGENVQLQLVKGLLSKFFGKEGLQTRLTAIEGIFAEAVGNDPKYLHRLIDGLESGEGVLGLEDAFAATRDKLGEEANLMVLVDLARVISGLVQTLRDVPPFDMILQQLPFNFGAQPASSYGGLSIGTEPQGLRGHLFVPVGQPKGVFQIFGAGL